MTTERDVLRELEAALDVSPSPDFVARVRERVKTQSMGVPRWTWPAGVAVAATVVLAVMLVPSRQVAPPQPEFARPEAPAPVAPAPEVRRDGESSRPSVEARPTTTDARTRRAFVPVRSGVESPAIVVPAGQMAAIQRLMHEVAAGRVVMGPERPAPPAVLQISALDAAPPIEFDTIKFTPLSADGSPDLWR
jgi:hypothetical protein